MSISPQAAHPVALIHQLLAPLADKRSVDLLATPGLELGFNARGALLNAFEEIARSTVRRQVLLPAFHCPSAITPAIMAGLHPVFYRIRRDLSIDTEDLQAKCGPDTAAGLVIHFFGQPPGPAPADILRKQGAKVVEDCSHSFLATGPTRLAGDAESDYRVFSFWKIVPSGVGGGLWRRDPPAGGVAALRSAPARASLRAYKLQLEESVHRNGWRAARAAMQALENARLKLRPKPQALAGTPPSVERGESHYPVSRQLAASRMPGFARRLLAASDLGAVAEQRRANYARYVSQAPQLRPMQLLFPALTASACPWVMPVLLENRSAIDFRLREAGVALHTFGIYLHSALFQQAADASIADARYLAERLLCLSIHQDLTPADIDSNVKTIARTMASLGLA